MPVAISKRLSSPWVKGGIALAAGAVVLLFIGLLFPTQAAFFPLVSQLRMIAHVRLQIRVTTTYLE